MKLTVENLGRIKKAELDIRPLTVFAGENGTNKTWTAYSLFTLLESLRYDGRRAPGNVKAPPELDAAVQRALAHHRKSHASSSGVTVSRSSRLDFFDRADPLEPLRFSIEAPAVRQAVAADVAADCSASVAFEKSEFLSGPVSALSLELHGKALNAEYKGSGAQEPLLTWAGGQNELESVFRHFALSRFGRVRCLPAERKLIAQIYPALLAPDQGVGRSLPRPLLDFAFLMAVGAAGNDVTQPGNPWLRRLSDVVGGTFDVAASGGAAWQFSPVGGPALPLGGSASLAKSLVGLAVFLARAAPGDVLFIDEPEMNAHPRAQAALLELLAMLVNGGIHVVLTTHSPYFVDHLTNLIEGSTLAPEKQEELRGDLYLKDVSALLKPEDVAVYAFEEVEGEVRPRLIIDREARDIDWATFSDVSDQVSNLFGRILRMKRGQDE